jgi:wyosine [tRNA(Phe)-imidazoG37] synthetase (radical SAM superfamily)
METFSWVMLGPVPSESLAQSLGINNIPYKNCTYACVYCPLGRAVKIQWSRQHFYSPDFIVQQARESLSKLPKENFPDYLTIVLDGEPIYVRKFLKK